MTSSIAWFSMASGRDSKNVVYFTGSITKSYNLVHIYKGRSTKPSTTRLKRPFLDGLIDNDEIVASPKRDIPRSRLATDYKNHTLIKTKMAKN